MRTRQVALFLGRFQPFHLGHLGVVRRLSRRYRKVIIAIGSSQFSRTADNPFSFAERRQMIRLALKETRIKNYSIVAVPDIGNHAKWVSWTEQCAKRPFQVVFTGNAFVAGLFRKAGYLVRVIRETRGVSATRIRRYMSQGANWRQFVPKAIVEKVEELHWKEAMFKKLKTEEEITEWAVKLQKTARKQRVPELKKKGLL